MLEKIEVDTLQPFACLSKNVDRNNVTKHPFRTEFQRDRDRILHSKAFRRLEYKTQVFLTKKGDHLRTRLTHSLEVSQLSRTVALQLGLNCDLVEAISLGHDLGHTPFGHAGERELISLFEIEGIKTFKHNVQSVRIVELLEQKYSYPGLNLTMPVKEGILKHTSLPAESPDFCQDLFIDKPFSVTLEGQVVAIVDEIAQMTHDMDDYLRYNIIHYTELQNHPIFVEVQKFYQNKYDHDLVKKLKEIQDESRKKDTIIRCLVDYLVTNLITDSQFMLDCDDNIKPFELGKVYITFDDYRKKLVDDFHEYLKKLLFSDYRIQEMDYTGKNIVNKMFNHFKRFPHNMPEKTYETFKKYGDAGVMVIGDYISGMTDRYAIEQYETLFSLD